LSREVRCIWVGCGLFGREFAQVAKETPRFRVAATCDMNIDAAQSTARLFDVPAFADYEKALSDVEADAVAILTPNHMHCEMVLAAVARGKHVYCEKPMAMNVQECDRMLVATRAAGLKLMVGHFLRLRPNFAKMQEIIGSGILGPPIMACIKGFHGRIWPNWWSRTESGGGLLHRTGIHEVDLLRLLCGDVASVSARVPVKTDHVSDFADSMTLILAFQCGALGTLVFSNLFPVDQSTSFGVDIACENGGIAWDAKRGVLEYRRWDGELSALPFPDVEACIQQAYRRELKNFVDALLDDTPIELTGENALRAVEIIEAAYLSAEISEPISLPLPRRDTRKEVLQNRFGKGIQFPKRLIGGFSRPIVVASRAGLYIADSTGRLVETDHEGGNIRHIPYHGMPSGLDIDPDGSLLVADVRDSTIKRIPLGEALQAVCVCYRDPSRITRPIAVASGKTGVYFLATGSSPDENVLALVDAGGEARVIANGLRGSIAIAVSPSSDELYITETTQREVTKYLLDQKGMVVERMTFAKLPACPAGLCLDYNANIFVAVPDIGRVFVFSERGELSAKLWVPGSHPNSVAVGGSVLFIGESDLGAVWALPLPASAKGPTAS